MRAYILTETERQLLKRYLETGTKTSSLLVLLHRIRKNLSTLKEDVDLSKRALVHVPVKEKEKRRRAREQEKKEPRLNRPLDVVVSMLPHFVGNLPFGRGELVEFQIDS